MYFIIGLFLGFILCAFITFLYFKTKTEGILRIITSEDNAMLLELHKPLSYILKKDHIILTIRKNNL